MSRRLGPGLDLSCGEAAWLEPAVLRERWAALGSPLAGVFQETTKALPGRMALVGSQPTVLEFIRRVRARKERLGSIESLDASALREVGSSFLNAAAGGIATSLGLEVGTGVPIVREGDAAGFAPAVGMSLFAAVSVRFGRFSGDATVSWELSRASVERICSRFEPAAVGEM